LKNIFLNTLWTGFVVLRSSAARCVRPATLIYVFSTQCLCLSRNRLFYVLFWFSSCV